MWVIPILQIHFRKAADYERVSKVLKTKEDYYNCLAMVASGELAAADLLAKSRAQKISATLSAV